MMLFFVVLVSLHVKELVEILLIINAIDKIYVILYNSDCENRDYLITSSFKNKVKIRF